MAKHAAGHRNQSSGKTNTDRAYNRGMRDRQRGVSYSQCPYSDKDLVFNWEAGWATQNGIIKLEEMAK